MTNDKPEITPDCCEVWPWIAHRFQWKAFEDCPDLLTMPFIRANGKEWRVNFCPSCGSDIRNIVTTMHKVW